MGKKPRLKPERLAAKLLAIRQNLGISQFEMAKRIDFPLYTHLSEYESGRREPNLILLLRYARVAGCTVDHLIDDQIELPIEDRAGR